jgi:hypothetical protein
LTYGSTLKQVSTFYPVEILCAIEQIQQLMWLKLYLSHSAGGSVMATQDIFNAVLAFDEATVTAKTQAELSTPARTSAPS